MNRHIIFGFRHTKVAFRSVYEGVRNVLITQRHVFFGFGNIYDTNIFVALNQFAMPVEKISIRARIEEVPTLGQFSVDSYNRDIADFQSYKPAKYTAGWLTILTGLITSVSGIVNPKQLLAELSVITLRLDSNMLLLRPLMNKLEGYVRDATGLTIPKNKFGISEVRKAISNGDQEKLNQALTDLLHNIANNNAALTTAGMPASIVTDITGLQTSIFNDNAAQNAKMQQKALLVTSNMGVINQLCDILKSLWADGKSLYKTSNATKLKDYTNTQLINRIRQEELKTKITGVVKGTNGPEAKAKVVAKPTDGGRTKTVYTNKNGEFELKGLKPGATNLSITTTSGAQAVVQATAVTGTAVAVPPIAIP